MFSTRSTTFVKQMEYKATEKHTCPVSSSPTLPPLGVKESLTGTDRGIRRRPVEMSRWPTPTDDRMDHHRWSEKPPPFLNQRGFTIEGIDDITLSSCPHLVRSILSDLNKMSTGHQRRTETQMPQRFIANVKKQQDLPPLVDTPVNLVQNKTANQKLLRRVTEFSTGHERRTDSPDTDVPTLSGIQSELLEKKKRSRRQLNKIPIGHRRKTEKPDHQDVSSSNIRLPPLVVTPNNLVQKTKKGRFREQQDVRSSETLLPPLTGTPAKMFKKEVSVRGLNKTHIRQHRRIEKPQISYEDFKVQPDVSSSGTHLSPLIPTKDFHSNKGLTGHVRWTETRELPSCTFTQQQEVSSPEFSHLLTATPASLIRNTNKCRMSLIGLNQIHIDRQKRRNV